MALVFNLRPSPVVESLLTTSRVVLEDFQGLCASTGKIITVQWSLAENGRDRLADQYTAILEITP